MVKGLSSQKKRSTGKSTLTANANNQYVLLLAQATGITTTEIHIGDEISDITDVNNFVAVYGS